MADLLLQQVFLNEINQDQANDGKHEIEAQVILPNKIHLECRLDEMREILDCYRSQSGEKSDKYAQQIDELLVAEVFIPPPEELFPQFFNLGHAIEIRIIPDPGAGSRRLKLRIKIKGGKDQGDE
mgnify:FL=1